jgi:hypothetical protein
MFDLTAHSNSSNRHHRSECSTTPFAEVGVAEEIASASLCDPVRSAATESPEVVCLKDDDDIEVLGEVSRQVRRGLSSLNDGDDTEVFCLKDDDD